jgi:hypothetical protein
MYTNLTSKKMSAGPSQTSYRHKWTAAAGQWTGKETEAPKKGCLSYICGDLDDQSIKLVVQPKQFFKNER